MISQFKELTENALTKLSWIVQNHGPIKLDWITWGKNTMFILVVNDQVNSCSNLVSLIESVEEQLNR